MRKKNEFITALPSLKPIMVIDEVNGVILTPDEWGSPVHKLLNYVKYQAERTYAKHKQKLLTECEDSRGSANSYGRKLGYRLNPKSLPKHVLAKSRIQELYLYNLITTVRSYTESTNQDKQEPSFTMTINLGAVDKQMATISRDGSELSLSWKVWDKQLLFIFQIPDYIQNYEIHKWCLPIIRVNNNGELVWGFSIIELFKQQAPGTDRIGVDWGVVKPYTVAVVNRNKRLIAIYNPSKYLMKLVEHKNNLVREKKLVNEKMDRLTKYKTHQRLPLLEQSRRELSLKISHIGELIAKQSAHEITNKIQKHHSNTVNVENLKWVSGYKGAKVGSNHSFQTARYEKNLTHSLKRAGVKTKRVNPKNTSQKCATCGNFITHNTKNRIIHCQVCNIQRDRDINAAWNITKTTLGSYRLPRDQNKGIKPTLVVANQTTQSLKPLLL